MSNQAHNSARAEYACFDNSDQLSHSRCKSFADANTLQTLH